MATPDQIRRFVASTRPKDWYGQCAGLTYRTIKDNGGSSPDDPYPSAFAAYRAATIESLNPAAAPPGAIHYWDYHGTDNRGLVNRWGHVAIDIHGGGTQVLSATGHAHDYWGVRAGLISVAAQSARGMPYLGWSRFYGRRNRLEITVAQPASGKGQPLPVITPEEEEETDMFIIVIGEAWYLCIPKPGGGYHAVAQPGDPDKHQSEGNKRIPVKNFTSADKRIRTELAKVVTGLPTP